MQDLGNLQHCEKCRKVSLKCQEYHTAGDGHPVNTFHIVKACYLREGVIASAEEAVLCVCVQNV